MDQHGKVLTLGASLVAEAAALRKGAVVPASAIRELRLAEARGSLQNAGIWFGTSEIVGLVESGLTPAGRTLEHCNAVADYAAAAAHIAGIGRRRPNRGLVRLEEIIALHALATRRSSSDRPGKWRLATAPALPSGSVPPAAWLVPRSMSAFVERFEAGPRPDRPLLVWLADCYERFIRIHPFGSANGRVARLLLNLILARLALPPLVLLGGDGPKLTATLAAADAGELWPCSLFLGRNLMRSVRTLEFARERSAETLLPLAGIVPPEEVAALYKAAQRGRLRTVRRGTGVFTSNRWLDEYRSSRAPAGRPPVAASRNERRT